MFQDDKLYSELLKTSQNAFYGARFLGVNMNCENILMNTLSQGGYWHINKPLARTIRLKRNRIAYATYKRAYLLQG